MSLNYIHHYHDFDHNYEPKLLVQEEPITNFSSKLPRHNFTEMWNKLDEKIRHVNHRSHFK